MDLELEDEEERGNVKKGRMAYRGDFYMGFQVLWFISCDEQA